LEEGNGNMEPGQVLNVIFAIYYNRCFSLRNATPHINSIGVALGTAANTFETIERKSPIDPLSDEGLKPEVIKGLIEFKNIDFHYSTRSDVPVLIIFNLTVEPGKSVALVGSSGSGKSTAVKLFERLYDPVSGSVTLDGVDIRALNVNRLESSPKSHVYLKSLSEKTSCCVYMISKV
jgi:ATP-binding cassette subfamily B (MDR/TAP) protein 1